ncbi:hypothetical protein [Limnohabitans sp.]|jgi:hypothetical protein|uniref:hypothetical protein n=1 Tax=Limnohabitans sp. TaxID=1907725 RepID=UPI00333EC75F
MNPIISELLARIQHMESEIELEMKLKRAELKADFDETRVRFEREVLEQQRRFKTGVIAYLFTANWLSVITAPVIYALFFPILLLDLCITIYQHICFRAYGLARVRRGDYFVYDRTHLAYLNLIEKINCAYCSYGNGVMAYGREVVARTEQYWCPIKHARKIMGAHPYYTGFVDFGNAQSYKEELENMRTALAKIK